MARMERCHFMQFQRHENLIVGLFIGLLTRTRSFRLILLYNIFNKMLVIHTKLIEIELKWKH